MKKIILNILAQDILEARYLDSEDCPITRALSRAGFPEYEDAGEILDENGVAIATIENNNSYVELVKKLFGMYHTKDGRPYKLRGYLSEPTPIEDFEHTLILE